MASLHEINKYFKVFLCTVIQYHVVLSFSSLSSLLLLYRITKYLGSGQFATVNKAQWITGGGDVSVAVKMLKTGSSEQEKVKFLQEAAINGQFHHLNVVRLLGVVTVGEPVCEIESMKYENMQD